MHLPVDCTAGTVGFLTGTAVTTGRIVADRVGDCPQRGKRRGGYPVVQSNRPRADAMRVAADQNNIALPTTVARVRSQDGAGSAHCATVVRRPAPPVFPYAAPSCVAQG